MRCFLTSRGRVQRTEETGLRQLEAAVASLDQGGDRDALLQQHDTAFCLPFRFHYHPHEGDQVPPPAPAARPHRCPFEPLVSVTRARVCRCAR